MNRYLSTFLDSLADCSADMLILKKVNSGENGGKLITHRVDINATGLVAPNVYVIPPFNSKSQSIIPNLSKQGLFCDGCNIWYKRQKNFITHQLHCPLIKTYVCTLCNYAANDKCDMIKHTEQHTLFPDILNCSLKNVCSVCNRVLSTKMALKLHMRTHSGEKPYTCQYCDKAFAQKNSLNYHEQTHISNKSYHCRFCRKGFNGKLVLQTHERIHTGERPYQCVICGAGFRCLANLRQHQLIHTDEKLFKCSECNKTFHRPEKVKIHMRTHTGEKPYACPICSRGFSQKGDMMKHTFIHYRTNEVKPCTIEQKEPRNQSSCI